MKEFDNYLEKMPFDFEEILKGIGKNIRFSILLVLNDKGIMSFTEIAIYLEIEKGLLSNHIKILEVSGLIQNFLEKREYSKEFSFYEMTSLGKKMLSDLISNYNNLYPETKISVGSTLPKKLLGVLNVVKSKFRFTLGNYLIDEGPVSFTEIVEMSGKSKSTIYSHLKRMKAAEFIENFYEKREDTNNYSYYRITPLGKKIIEGLISSYNQYYSENDIAEENREDSKKPLSSQVHP